MSAVRLGSLRAKPERWSVIRGRIWLRDGNRCLLCGYRIKPEGYECGHIVDRMCGGSDEDDNLAVMCIICNRLKPAHSTREEFDAWMADGGMRKMVRESLEANPPTAYDLLLAKVTTPDPYEAGQ